MVGPMVLSLVRLNFSGRLSTSYSSSPTTPSEADLANSYNCVTAPCDLPLLNLGCFSIDHGFDDLLR